MQEHYEIENVEQLRAISDMLRIRIVDVLREKPMTATQLADLLGMAPAKVYYHVRELEKVGLLRLVETREKSGILEKYYQPVARDIAIPKGLLFSASTDDVMGAIGSWFDQIKDTFIRTMQKRIVAKEEQTQAIFSFAYIYTKYEEHKQLYQQIGDLLRPYETRRGIEGEEEMLATFILSPLDNPLAEGVAAVTTNEVEDTVGTSPAGLAQDGTSALHTWVVGVTNFTRAQLEDVVAQGKRMHINVVGLCRFDEDVSAELAARAIEEFRLVGKLQAPGGVREVVMSKRAEQ